MKRDKELLEKNERLKPEIQLNSTKIIQNTMGLTRSKTTVGMTQLKKITDDNNMSGQKSTGQSLPKYASTVQTSSLLDKLEKISSTNALETGSNSKNKNRLLQKPSCFYDRLSQPKATNIRGRAQDVKPDRVRNVSERRSLPRKLQGNLGTISI